MLHSMTGVCSNMEPSFVLIAIYITALLYCRVVAVTSFDDEQRKTLKAAERGNDLQCFVCDSMDSGDRCSNMSTTNNTFASKCQDDKRTCMVKRYSYKIIDGYSTAPSVERLWAVQRNCTSKCEPGCIVIGERTKLYACTVCCGTDNCNSMNDGAPTHQHSTLVTVFCILVLTAFTS